MGKLCLRPASPVPLAHTQGLRHLTVDRSGLSHTRIMARLEPGSLTPSLHAASGDDVPCLLQYQELALCHPLPRGLPESSFRIAQRLPHLPRGWSQTISQGSSMSAFHQSTATLQQGKPAVQDGQCGTGPSIFERCRHGRTHLHRLTKDEQGQQNAMLPSMIQ